MQPPVDTCTMHIAHIFRLHSRTTCLMLDTMLFCWAHVIQLDRSSGRTQWRSAFLHAPAYAYMRFVFKKHRLLPFVIEFSFEFVFLFFKWCTRAHMNLTISVLFRWFHCIIKIHDNIICNMLREKSFKRRRHQYVQKFRFSFFSISGTSTLPSEWMRVKITHENTSITISTCLHSEPFLQNVEQRSIGLMRLYFFTLDIVMAGVIMHFYPYQHYNFWGTFDRSSEVFA